MKIKSSLVFKDFDKHVAEDVFYDFFLTLVSPHLDEVYVVQIHAVVINDTTEIEPARTGKLEHDGTVVGHEVSSIDEHLKSSEAAHLRNDSVGNGEISHVEFSFLCWFPHFVEYNDTKKSGRSQHFSSRFLNLIHQHL